MPNYLVVLKGPGGARYLEIEADDEWEARQRAIRQNVAEQRPVAWVDKVKSLEESQQRKTVTTST